MKKKFNQSLYDIDYIENSPKVSSFPLESKEVEGTVEMRVGAFKKRKQNKPQTDQEEALAGQGELMPNDLIQAMKAKVIDELNMFNKKGEALQGQIIKPNPNDRKVGSIKKQNLKDGEGREDPPKVLKAVDLGAVDQDGQIDVEAPQMGVNPPDQKMNQAGWKYESPYEEVRKKQMAKNNYLHKSTKKDPITDGLHAIEKKELEQQYEDLRNQQVHYKKQMNELIEEQNEVLKSQNPNRYKRSNDIVAQINIKRKLLNDIDDQILDITGKIATLEMKEEEDKHRAVYRRDEIEAILARNEQERRAIDDEQAMRKIDEARLKYLADKYLMNRRQPTYGLNRGYDGAAHVNDMDMKGLNFRNDRDQAHYGGYNYRKGGFI